MPFATCVLPPLWMQLVVAVAQPGAANNPAVVVPAAVRTSFNLSATGASPTAERIYFRRAGSVMVFDLARHTERVLWPERSSDDHDAPAVSRDGSSVFFSQRGNLWAIPSSGGMPERITRLGRERQPGGKASVCDHPLPSPDGVWLAYRYSPPAAAPQLRLVRADGEQDQMVDEGPEPDATWSPDGRLIFASDGRLWQWRPGEGEPSRVTSDSAGEPHESHPDWLPDGRLLFLDDGVPMLLGPEGSLVPLTPGRLDGAASVSPDGGRAALLREPLDPRDPTHGWVELHDVRVGEQRSRLVLSTYAAGGLNGHAELLGWLDASHVLVLRDLNEACRKVYAVSVDTSQAELIFKGQDRDDGFVVWPAP